MGVMVFIPGQRSENWSGVLLCSWGHSQHRFATGTVYYKEVKRVPGSRVQSEVNYYGQ